MRRDFALKKPACLIRKWIGRWVRTRRSCRWKFDGLHTILATTHLWKAVFAEPTLVAPGQCTLGEIPFSRRIHVVLQAFGGNVSRNKILGPPKSLLEGYICPANGASVWLQNVATFVLYIHNANKVNGRSCKTETAKSVTYRTNI